MGNEVLAECIFTCLGYLYLSVRLILTFCCLKVLLRAVHWLFPDFAFMWLVDEAKKNMPLELDFINEGHNAERVANMLAHYPFLKVLAYIYENVVLFCARLPFITKSPWNPPWDSISLSMLCTHTCKQLLIIRDSLF